MRADGAGEGLVCRAAREGLSCKVTSEQRAGEAGEKADIWRKKVSGAENSQSKGPEMEYASHF